MMFVHSSNDQTFIHHIFVFCDYKKSTLKLLFSISYSFLFETLPNKSFSMLFTNISSTSMHELVHTYVILICYMFTARWLFFLNLDSILFYVKTQLVQFIFKEFYKKMFYSLFHKRIPTQSSDKLTLERKGHLFVTSQKNLAFTSSNVIYRLWQKIWEIGLRFQPWSVKRR